MKYLYLFIISLFVFSCSPTKKVYWCGDHACINKKEREAYFRKTMIVEIKDSTEINKKNKSELEEIRRQAELNEKKRIQKEKDIVKKEKFEKKRLALEEKKLAKQRKIEEKNRIKNEKKLAKQIRKDEKKLLSKKRIDSSKKNTDLEKKQEKNVLENITNANLLKNDSKFEDLVKKITRKNSLRPFPSINDIPN